MGGLDKGKGEMKTEIERLASIERKFKQMFGVAGAFRDQAYEWAKEGMPRGFNDRETWRAGYDNLNNEMRDCYNSIIFEISLLKREFEEPGCRKDGGHPKIPVWNRLPGSPP